MATQGPPTSSVSEPVAPAAKWWTPGTIAVVTGANQGIGKEIARQLASHGLTVVATARGGPQRSADACAELSADPAVASSGGRVLPASLDVTDDASVQALADRVRRGDFGDASGGGGCPLAILVNNAGIAFNGSTFGPDEARLTVGTNFRGTRRVTRALLPLMRRSCAGAGLLPRVVNVSSSAASLAQFDRVQQQDGARALKRRFVEAAAVADEAAGDALLDALVGEFEEAVADGTWRQKGWLPSMYSVSKVALNAYGKQLAARGAVQGSAGGGGAAEESRADQQQQQQQQQQQTPFVAVNVHPGYVSTRMSSYMGNLKPSRGADSPVWAALLPPDAAARASGAFYFERQLKDN